MRGSYRKERKNMKRSKRIEALDARPVNLDGYINEWPEMGFIAMNSPYDPKPSVKVEDGRIVELVRLHRPVHR